MIKETLSSIGIATLAELATVALICGSIYVAFALASGVGA